MRIDALTVVLRPRSSWEAVELGTALVRRHAAAVWRPWLGLTLPVFALVNLVAHAIDALWLAALFMWWLKPLFARLPLFVLSRAVFGEVPDARTTLREGLRGAGGAMLGYLTWRRLTPARALLMPVDVLEGGSSAQAAARRRVVAGSAYGVAALTLLVFLNFEAVVAFGLGTLVFLFVPEEHLLTSLQRLWEHLRDAPVWLALLENALLWAATLLLEPFHVGAGFGLYLNRRTEIEGWDIDLAFRGLRARLQAGATALGLVLALGLAAGPANAAEPATCLRPGRIEGTLPTTFGRDYAPSGRFDDAVARAYRDPRISPKRTVTTWKPRVKPDEPKPGDRPGWLGAIARGFATLGELSLWIIAGVLVALLASTARRWWPWLRSFAQAPVDRPSPVSENVVPGAEPLPDDVPAAARRLWAQRQPRAALALVYRACVESMATATGRVLPPGATEAHCLRAAAALPEGPRSAFGQAVRLWQAIAYADRVPSNDAFEAMLTQASTHFGWAR